MQIVQKNMALILKHTNQNTLANLIWILRQEKWQLKFLLHNKISVIFLNNKNVNVLLIDELHGRLKRITLMKQRDFLILRQPHSNSTSMT